MRKRRVDPDFVLDADRGVSSAGLKQADLVAPGAFAGRAGERSGARDLDRTVEQMPGLTRQQRDRERAMPRETNAALGHRRMLRTLPTDGQLRRPVSSRQRKARSVSKRTAQDAMPHSQHTEMERLLRSQDGWSQVNDPLSAATGDAQALTDGQRQTVQRLDRAIQGYERVNERGHVVYCAVRMPRSINSSNLEPYLRRSFETGTRVEFDRYTGGAHNLHELEAATGDSRTAVFEIQTRRGMYLGRSDSVADTAHLLPRGLQLRVAGTHPAAYLRPDGSTAVRQVVQLVDVTPTETITSPSRKERS